jgi:hypothetical protein
MSPIPLNFDPISFVMALIMIVMNAIQLYWNRPQLAAPPPDANAEP